MTRQRMFLNISCVDAARQRMRHIYDTFDTVCVQFSGGKDSTATLYLAKEIHEERGLGPVKVIFRDEEMVSPRVIEYVEKVRNYPWVDMEWYCLPVGGEIWVLGRRQSVIIWSKTRETQNRLIRPIPPFAITAESFGLDPSEPLKMSSDVYLMQGKKGLTAFITGVRANESMIRYRSLVQKLHENYIASPYKLSKKIPLRLAKPIYDWETDDVFKFIHEEHNAEYCSYYDVAAMTGSNTRVGIPLHSVAIRRIGDVIATEPEFYDRLVTVFPYIDAQRRLWKDIDTDVIINRYASKGFDGAGAFIENYMIGEHNKKRARSFVAEFRRKQAKDPRSYTMYQLIRTMLLNEMSPRISASPIGPKTKVHRVREMDIVDEN